MSLVASEKVRKRRRAWRKRLASRDAAARADAHREREQRKLGFEFDVSYIRPGFFDVAWAEEMARNRDPVFAQVDPLLIRAEVSVVERRIHGRLEGSMVAIRRTTEIVRMSLRKDGPWPQIKT